MKNQVRRVIPKPPAFIWDRSKHRIDNFLLSYCTTPHATTGETPSLLLLGHQIRTRFDLLQPDREHHFCSKQATQKTWHDTQTKDGEFQVGRHVLARDWRDTPAGWKPGVVAEHTGPLSYNILLDSGRTQKRYTEHLRELAPQPASDKEITMGQSQVQALFGLILRRIFQLINQTVQQTAQHWTLTVPQSNKNLHRLFRN